jgi:hypothetical protein
VTRRPRRAARSRTLGVLLCLLPLLIGLTGTAAAGDRGTRAPGAERPASVGAPAEEAQRARPDSRAAASARAVRCAKAGRAAGWRGDRLVLAVAISLAESDCTPGATGYNGPTSGCPSGSADRGAWQINDCYHAEVSDACAYDLWCNAREAYRISDDGADFTPWTTYNTGAYAGYWNEAEDGVNAPSGGDVYTVRTGTGGGYVNLRSGPDVSETAVGRVADAGTVHLSCWTYGSRHEGPWGSSNLWNRLTDGSWISDAFVWTGTFDPVVPRC